MNKVDLSKYFDKIYILTYLGCDYKTKLHDIEKQWNQLFINDFYGDLVEIKYSFNSPLFNRIYDSFKQENSNMRPMNTHELNVTIWHYLIAKEAAAFNYDHILVIEDDIVFLKNLQNIKNILDNLPEKYDICQLHKGYLCLPSIDKSFYMDHELKYNDYFYKVNNEKYPYVSHVSSACNCLSKDGMNIIIYIFEHWNEFSDNRKIICDTYYNLLSSSIDYFVAYGDLCLCCYRNETNNSTDNKFNLNIYKEEDYLIF